MKLLDRIRELRNEYWYSPFYTLQQLLKDRRQHNQLIGFDELLLGVYRIFTGRLDKPSRWYIPPITLKVSDKEPEVVEYSLKRDTSSNNHIGIFSFVFSFLDLAETALRGNMAKSDKTRTKMRLATLPLWGLINVTRAAFGVIGTAVSFIAVGIFYLVEKRRINKKLQDQAESELQLVENKVELNVIETIKRLNTAEEAVNIKNNNSYWVIKQNGKNYTRKIKTNPIKNHGNYSAIYSHNFNYSNSEKRCNETLGNKFELTNPCPQTAESPLAKASIFKMKFSKEAAKGNKDSKNPYDSKFIYIPPAAPR